MASAGQPERWVVAIGGNALADPRDAGSTARQGEQARKLAPALVDALAAGVRLVITHGNGAQVGARLIQNEAARDEVPPSSLAVAVAETQGQIGHELTLALGDALAERMLDVPVACLLTHVLVDPDAPEFQRPDKPIGPSYGEDEGRALIRERGWRMAKLSEGEWRRVVPSPRPIEVLELPAVRLLSDAGSCVIAGGGGGVPVAKHGSGLRAVDAVVDKDYTSALLATAVAASRLVILTDVPGAALDFDSPRSRFLDNVTASDARRYLDEGHFAAGSMRPKVEACLDFLAHGGREAVIAATVNASEALAGGAGTRIA